MILVLNKIDAVDKVDLLPLIAHWSGLHTFADVVLISARKEEGLELLLEKVIGHLKAGQRYFPADQVTDQPERFLVAELIREKILLLTGEEVPYSSAVVVEKWEEPASTKPGRDGRLPLTKIAAAIICERTGQKAILIGKGGEMLKRIGTAARKDIEGLAGHARVSPAVCEGAGGVAIKPRVCGRSGLAAADGASGGEAGDRGEVGTSSPPGTFGAKSSFAHGCRGGTFDARTVRGHGSGARVSTASDAAARARRGAGDGDAAARSAMCGLSWLIEVW